MRLLENLHKTLRRDQFTPVSDKTMQEDLPNGTICSVLREIYAKTRSDEIRYLSRLATAMAKKMSTKLTEYWRKERESAG